MDNTYQELVGLFSKQIVDHVLSFTLRDDILMRYVFSGQRGALLALPTPWTTPAAYGECGDAVVLALCNKEVEDLRHACNDD